MAVTVLLPPSSVPTTRPATALDGTTRARAESFLHDWVNQDGRVVRRDQGGDTVSEGQAYGMLLALALGDHARFDAIWTWTRTHLQRPDGSLAWIWRDGAVRDPQPAADADADTATALLGAGATWHDDALRRQGMRVSTALLQSSTVASAPGRLLAGGPWAVRRGNGPANVDPDYLVAGTASAFAAATGEAGWRAVATGTSDMQRALLRATALPPDWVSAPASGGVAAVRPSGAPGTSEAPQYGLSAPRLFIRLAASCSATDRALAAHASTAAMRPNAVAIRTLSDSDVVSWHNPITAVGAAAIDTARGDSPAAGRALDAAAAQNKQSPTYYGAAWLALGSVLLRSNRLGSCAGERT
ncbi:glycosyl hydrolase family 8 [uncultured Jatrophihabitans sp.]|uniref:glycosyl hydrolase family 8 n=1 Tax=uncultured Jatrophihabitans sp. TaxID=1610747 RepID=UPI0035C96544